MGWREKRYPKEHGDSPLPWQRKKFTEKKILGKILLETMIHGLFLLFATIERKKKFFFITSTEGIFLYMLVLIQLISCIHLMEYYDYMKKTNAWYTEMLGMIVIVKAILIWSSFYMEGMLFTVYIVPWLLAAVGLHYGDYKIVKKHFNNMINFYADYEYSRGIKPFQL